MLFFLSAIPNALAAEPTEGDADFAVEKLEMQWSAGERYNGLNGTLNYAHTDLYLPGNGKLPIEIIRQFTQRRVGGKFNPVSTFGYMGLAVPSVNYRIRDGGYSICSSSGRAGSTSSLASPMIFRHGETQKVFFGGSNGSAFTNPDGWKIECVASTGSLGYSNDDFGSLLVSRPDGIEYEMKRVFSGIVSTSANYRVHKMSDPYGNTLTYNYSTTDTSSVVRYGSIKLDSIVASDGRIVTISYNKVRVSVYTTTNTLYDTYRIDTIESNSSENPVKLKYTYPDSETLKVTKNDTETTTISMSLGKISSMTYPTGGTVSYSYQDRLTSAGVKYDTLKARTTSDGASYDFSYTDNGDDTFTRHIETPSAWLDYTYKHPRKPNQFGIVTNHVVDSGRLIQFRRYEPGTTGSPGSLLLNIDYTFANLSSPDVTSQAAQLVSPKKTIVRMNYDASNSYAKSIFTRDNDEFDEWGFPTQVLESTPDNIQKASTYTYQHDNFSRLILGKLATASRGGDTQSYTYNQQGDVKTRTVNGITVSYEWHQTGDSKGELHTLTSATDKSTSFSDYKRGQAQRITNPSNYSQNRVINDNASLASKSRFTKYLPASISGQPATEFEYDSLRRLKRIDPERSFSYDVSYLWLNNKTLNITDGGNIRYTRNKRLDDFGRIRSMGTYDRDQYRWSTVKYDYDTQGRLLFESYPQNVSPDSIINMNSLSGTHYRYDALDRILSVTNDENEGNDTVMSYVYASGEGGDLTKTVKDGRGSTTTTTYRSYGTPHYQWPIKIVDADGQITTLARDVMTGRIDSFTRGGQTTSYTYNSNKLLQSVTQDENGTTTFEYYADGQLKSRTNQGRQVEYQYYSDNVLYKEIYTDSTQESVTREFQYDAYRNLEYAITNSPSGSQNNTLHYTYDDDDNVKTQALIIDDLHYEVQFEYDELSKLKEITYPNSRRYALSPNSLGSPTAIQQIGGQGTVIYNTIQYNDNNSMKLMQRTGHQVTNELNNGQRPFKFRLEQYGNGQNSPLGERQYLYDKAANIDRIDDTVGNRYMSFTYDSRNRLTNENISNGDNWSYGYLPNDSIDWIQEGGLRSTYEYNPVNKRLSGVRTDNVHRQYGYDAQGNMTAHERLLDTSSKVTRVLTYNAANQLTAMSDGTAYSYDARGLRVKQDRGGAIYTLYDPNNRLIYRFDIQTGVSSEYFYVNDRLVARRDEDTSGDQSTTGITVSGRTISWPDDGWYQVQTEDGSSNVCEGGLSCTVPADGTYIVINHTTGARLTVVVGSSGTGSTDITVSGNTISWPDDGWYQVQTEDGSSNVCEGGLSCTVPADGTYIVINHTTGTRSTVVVGTPSTGSTDITVSGRTISWPDDGWYQVQTEDGSTNVCEGGLSCTVPIDGTYIVINHTTGTRTNVQTN